MLRIASTSWTMVALLGCVAVAGTYEAPLDVRKDGEVRFDATPKAESAVDFSGRR